MIAFSEPYRGGWLDLHAKPLELIEAREGRVVALVRQSSRGRLSGVPIVIHYFAVWTVSTREGAPDRVSPPPVRRPPRGGAPEVGARTTASSGYRRVTRSPLRATNNSTAPGTQQMTNAAPAQRPATAAASSRRSSPQNSSLPIATIGMPVTPRPSASVVWALSRSLISGHAIASLTASGSSPASWAARRTLSSSASERAGGARC